MLALIDCWSTGRCWLQWISWPKGEDQLQVSDLRGPGIEPTLNISPLGCGRSAEPDDFLCLQGQKGEAGLMGDQGPPGQDGTPVSGTRL